MICINLVGLDCHIQQEKVDVEEVKSIIGAEENREKEKTVEQILPKENGEKAVESVEEHNREVTPDAPKDFERGIWMDPMNIEYGWRVITSFQETYIFLFHSQLIKYRRRDI